MSLGFYVFSETCDNYKLSKRVQWGQTPTPLTAFNWAIVYCWQGVTIAGRKPSQQSTILS